MWKTSRSSRSAPRSEVPDDPEVDAPNSLDASCAGSAVRLVAGLVRAVLVLRPDGKPDDLRDGRLANSRHLAMGIADRGRDVGRRNLWEHDSSDLVARRAHRQRFAWLAQVPGEALALVVCASLRHGNGSALETARNVGLAPLGRSHVRRWRKVPAVKWRAPGRGSSRDWWGWSSMARRSRPAWAEWPERKSLLRAPRNKQRRVISSVVTTAHPVRLGI